MRVLIDECLPKKLRTYLTGHSCLTVQQAGWSGRRNGDLLTAAEGHFDVFLTIDKGVRYQQNLLVRRISILVLRVRTNQIEDVLPIVPDCLNALSSIRPGEVRTIERKS